MLFGKKEDEARLPDLPSSRGRVTSGKVALSGSNPGGGLPAFPDSPSENKPLQNTVKEADSDSGVALPPPPRNVKVIEMEEWQPSSHQVETLSPRGTYPELHETDEDELVPPPKPHFSEPPARAVKSAPTAMDDVFVRIDKFHSARRALSEVQNRLDDIDEVVKRIRETKLREEQELASWEKDLVHIKARVQSVNENIFEKVE